LTKFSFTVRHKTFYSQLLIALSHLRWWMLAIWMLTCWDTPISQGTVTDNIHTTSIAIYYMIFGEIMNSRLLIIILTKTCLIRVLMSPLSHILTMCLLLAELATSSNVNDHYRLLTTSIGSGFGSEYGTTVVDLDLSF